MFPSNSLYAGLTPSPSPNGFHWPLFITDGTLTSSKLHFSNRRSGGWKSEHVRENLFSSEVLLVATKLPHLPSGTTAKEVGTLLEGIPMETPEADQGVDFSCRIWFREAIRRLHDANLIRLSNVVAFEAYAKLLGEVARPIVETGEGKYTHVNSKYQNC